jgi:hypothetical protein
MFRELSVVEHRLTTVLKFARWGLSPLRRAGQLPPGVFVPGFCALPQLINRAAPGQPGGQAPPGVIVSGAGEHSRHIHIALMTGWPDQRGAALLSGDELA